LAEKIGSGLKGVKTPTAKLKRNTLFKSVSKPIIRKIPKTKYLFASGVKTT